MRTDLTIASAVPADAAEIAALYAHHVVHGTATFETVPPGTDEIAARMAKVRDAGMPWLVARNGQGLLLGYAYAGTFRERIAYRYTAENAIYIRHDCRGQGIGTALMMPLIEAAEACGLRQMIAAIAGSEPASIALHAKAGFVEAGRFAGVGRKHGRWLDVIYMQRVLGKGDTTAPGEEP